MVANTRLNLGSEVGAKKLLNKCRPQVQLYTEKLLGCQSGARANVSKFKAKLQALFPVKFQDQSLELRDVEISDDPEAEAGAAAASLRASIKLEWLRYGKIQGVLYIQQRQLVTLPLVRAPKLPASDILSINGIEKVLVSQLGRQPGIRIEADKNSIALSFLKDNATAVQIRADRETCSVLCGGCEVGLLQALMAMGVTKSNIIRVLHSVKTVVYTNGEWCELSFRETAEEGKTGVFGEAYG